MTLLSIPSPAQGVWHLGPLPDPRLRAVHHPRHRRRDLDRRAALGRPRRPAGRGQRPGDLGGAVRPRRRPALPRDHRPRPLLRRGPAPDRRRSTSGAAASASGARSRSARSASWIGARRKGIRLLPVLDALAPGVLVAQAIGRWGNWFNQELFGRPTDLPWGLEIDAAAPAAAATRPVRHLPPDVPLRVPLEPRRLRRRDLGSTAASGSATAGWSRST